LLPRPARRDDRFETTRGSRQREQRVAASGHSEQRVAAKGHEKQPVGNEALGAEASINRISTNESGASLAEWGCDF